MLKRGAKRFMRQSYHSKLLFVHTELHDWLKTYQRLAMETPSAHLQEQYRARALACEVAANDLSNAMKTLYFVV